MRSEQWNVARGYGFLLWCVLMLMSQFQLSIWGSSGSALALLVAATLFQDGCYFRSQLSFLCDYFCNVYSTLLVTMIVWRLRSIVTCRTLARFERYCAPASTLAQVVALVFFPINKLGSNTNFCCGLTPVNILMSSFSFYLPVIWFFNKKNS